MRSVLISLNHDLAEVGYLAVREYSHFRDDQFQFFP